MLIRLIAGLGVMTVCALAGESEPVAHADFSVRLDARFELEGILLRLSGISRKPSPLSPAHERYLGEIDEAFARFRRHPAVVYYAGLDPESAAFKAHLSVLSDLSDPPGLVEEIPVYRRMIGTFRGRENIDAWLRLMRQFSAAADFPNFLTLHAAALRENARQLEEIMRARYPIAKAEAYAGIPFRGRFTVCLTGALDPGLFVSHVERAPDGSYDLIIMAQAGGAGDAAEQADWLAASFLHELAHGLLDPLQAGHAPELGLVDPRYEVREYVAHAVSLRLVRLMMGNRKKPPLSREFLERDIMEKLASLLETYESSRDRYPTLADYYPRLLEAFPKAPAGLPKTEQAKPPPVETEVPSSAEDWRERAMARFQAGDAAGALSDVDRALALAPGNPDALSDRGVMLERSGRLKEALADYDELIAACRARAREPSFREMLADALTARAAVLAKLGNEAQARADLDEARLLESRSMPAEAAPAFEERSY